MLILCVYVLRDVTGQESLEKSVEKSRSVKSRKMAAKSVKFSILT